MNKNINNNMNKIINKNMNKNMNKNKIIKIMKMNQEKKTLLKLNSIKITHHFKKL